MPPELNQYEKARLENIRKNEEILAALDLPRRGLGGQSLGGPTVTHQGKSRPKSTKPPLDSQLLRRSSRLSAAAAVDENLGKGLGEGTKREAESRSLLPSKRPRITGNLPLHDVSNDPDSPFVSLDYFPESVEKLPSFPEHTKVKGEGKEKWDNGKEDVERAHVKIKKEEEEEPRTEGKTEEDEAVIESIPPLDPNREQHQGSLDILKCTHRHRTVRVVPKRIYSAAFHPQPQPIVLAAGDKEGNLGIWRVHGVEEVPEEASEKVQERGPTPLIHSWRPHYNAIVDIQWVNQGASLLTASYDTSIRRFDPSKEIFEDVWDEEESEVGLLACMDASYYPVIWYSTHTGKVGRRDIRMGKKEEGKGIWSVLDDKIGCVQVNPRQPHYLATASRDRAVRIWDIRALRPEGSEPVAEMPHGKSVTSAYWDPLGTRVVTTSHDDHVRVFGKWDGTAFQSQKSMSHNNQTGRWLTMFRARWNPVYEKNPMFVITSKDRGVEVFSEECVKYWRGDDPDRLTTVPAVSIFHPTIDAIAGANTSGHMLVWDGGQEEESVLSGH
ncbi:WD40-repeat-containing domain protein [Piptocephalis cylindrospora]|uniref:DNA damage-binding protein CMR1 n=1 Tax=Piptocephalis cylindrospora TaxID=1907219 RepID=A0A4P9Y8M1_9FUNG|nr:WD40-repeat-containing domain protein [Piptocephalis cylindrospora]|eukprot:RKP15448.1 WD40-repeat-containing domain protein [Piptocephalis cylindrospora]